jgi:hypothetical protein
LWTIRQGWLWIAVLLISASWVARITGVGHQCLVRGELYNWWPRIWSILTMDTPRIGYVLLNGLFSDHSSLPLGILVGWSSSCHFFFFFFYAAGISQPAVTSSEFLLI